MSQENKRFFFNLKGKILDSRFEYSLHQKPQVYPVDRSFYHKSKERGHWLEPVLAYLPVFKGENCDFWIRERTESYSHPIRVLDIGCGTGRAVKEIENRYPKKVLGFGMTAFKYSLVSLFEDRLIRGDASYIKRYFPNDFFDIIFSSQTLPYTKRHLANLTPKIYRILAPRGLAFLDVQLMWDLTGRYLGSDKTFVGLDKLKRWLSEHGYSFDFWRGSSRGRETSVKGCAFQKTHERLFLPVTYDKHCQVVFDEKKAEKYSSMIN